MSHLMLSSITDDPTGVLRDSTQRLLSATPPATPGLGWMIFKTVLVLGLIISLIFITIYLLRRYGGARFSQGNAGWFNVVARISIQPKQSIALVKVHNRFILLGMSEGAICTLAEFSDSREVAELTELVGRESNRHSAGNFAELLKARFQ